MDEWINERIKSSMESRDMKLCKVKTEGYMILKIFCYSGGKHISLFDPLPKINGLIQILIIQNQIGNWTKAQK